MKRKPKDERYLQIAIANAIEFATCRRASFGALIVDAESGEILATGFCGAPRKTTDCYARGRCFREEMGVPHGERYEICESIHAEMNAALHAGVARCRGNIMYIAGVDPVSKKPLNASPCFWCLKFIINVGIEHLYMLQADGSIKYWSRYDMLTLFDRAFTGNTFNYDISGDVEYGNKDSNG